MKHTLLNASVFKDGKVLVPGDDVDMTKEELIAIGELDTEGNPLGIPSAVAQAIAAVRLPDDAKERLMSLDRMTEKRAEEIIDVLNGVAPEPAAKD